MGNGGVNKLSWLVTYYDCNANRIRYYDIFKYREDFIKKLKKKCATKEEFASKIDSELHWSYWSKCEWEMIIEIDDNGHVWLSPWVGCRNPEDVRVDVTDRTDFDWYDFATEHIGKQIYKNEAKIDVYDQLTYKDQFEKLVDYLWYTRLRYERNSAKFNRETEETI